MVVIVALNDLLPDFKAAILDTKTARGWDDAGVRRAVAQHYGFLGPFLNPRIEKRTDDAGVETDWLIVEFRPPSDRDLEAATRDFQTALELADAGSIEAATAILWRVAGEFPEIPNFHAALGQACLAVGEDDEAENALLRALTLNPRDHRALMVLGNLYMQREDPEQALGSYEKALRVERTAVALTNYGGALGQLGNLDGAIDAFRSALALDPEYEKAQIGLGLALSQRPDDNT